jgi:hypothetical protein
VPAGYFSPWPRENGEVFVWLQKNAAPKERLTIGGNAPDYGGSFTARGHP